MTGFVDRHAPHLLRPEPRGAVGTTRTASDLREEVFLLDLPPGASGATGGAANEELHVGAGATQAQLRQEPRLDPPRDLLRALYGSR